MSDIIGALKNKPRDYEIRADRAWMTMERSEFLELITEVEHLTKERDEWKETSEANSWRKEGLRKAAIDIKALAKELDEWVAKSHAWLTASMAQDDEITALKASLEASEKKVEELTKPKPKPMCDNESEAWDNDEDY